jgi:DNA phosphorothioation-associated putative methyltransferase
LETEAVPAALGIFYVFREESLRQQFLANRYRHRSTAPRRRLTEIQFEEHRSILEPLMRVLGELGRLPEGDEFEFMQEVTRHFGSLKRAVALIRRVTGEEAWTASGMERRDDLLVYLALSRFRRRPRFSELPTALQRDIRAFFGTYNKACHEADGILFQAGNAGIIDRACQESKIGKLLPNALYVHKSALESLVPLLRVYEGCGRAYLGELPGTNVVKIHRFSGKLSYLEYPDFDSDPHPVLTRSYKLAMRTQHLDFYDYMLTPNPPLLHRKEAFLEPTYPLYSRFARLTQQEEKHRLLDDSRLIGTKDGWETRLRQAGFALRGHRLVRTTPTSDERIGNGVSAHIHG